MDGLQINYVKLDTHDNEILRLMIEDGEVSDDAYEAEFLAIEEYNDEVRVAKCRSDNYFETHIRSIEVLEASEATATSSAGTRKCPTKCG